MFRGHCSRCRISTSVSRRRDGSSVWRTRSSNWSVPKGLRKQMRVTGASGSVGVSAVVIGGEGGPDLASREAVGGERVEQSISAEPGDLAREQLGGQRGEQDAAAAPAVERRDA